MGGQGSGGANGGSQYNPANVSGTGGAGQSGDYTGFAYGQNKQINQDRVEGNKAVSSVGDAGITSSQGPYEGMTRAPLGTLTDPTTDNLPISAGVDFGGGPGSDALPKNFGGINNTRSSENQQIIKNYLPDLAFAAQSPNAPDSFKRFVNYLVENNQGFSPNG